MLTITRCTACMLAFSCLAITVNAQYYYKDIVVTGQINAGYRALRDNKVSLVTLTTTAPGPAANAEITLQQTVYPAQKLVVTYTKTPDAGESWLKSYYNENALLVQTTDSTQEIVTKSVYQYANDRLASISSKSVPVNSASETEVHQWSYNGSGQPLKMIKIRNNNDSTVVSFMPDEQGNTGEEKAVRNKVSLGTTFYYFDAQHRLTDVARYNKKADRILPNYIFEYNEGTLPAQMMLVPEGSNEYQIWKYVYNQQGLKEKEICYNKQKQLVGTVSYVYTFGK
ncbi:MAG: hypothetical protein ABIU63_01800 [Chitinophagaceae bacterium]